MNILCVDDENLALERLVDMVKKACPQDKVFGYSDFKEIDGWLKKYTCELAFLDIQMPEIDGITLAERIRTINKNCKLCFVTAYSEYALKSYQIHADGYILKPISQESINEQVYYFFGKSLKAKCFGNFEMYYQNRPLIFKRSKAKEFLAYLIDRKGQGATKNEIIARLYGDRNDDAVNKMFSNIVVEARRVLSEIGYENFLINTHNNYLVNKEIIDCDYYDFLNDHCKHHNYNNQYMYQYSWAEETNSYIQSIIDK